MRVEIPFLIFAFLVAGCSPHIHISEIKYEPQKYQDELVSIKGRVIETLGIPFFQKGLYQMDDNTGKIWVVSSERMPLRGEEVVVKGKVKTGLTIANQTFGTVIIEGDEEER